MRITDLSIPITSKMRVYPGDSQPEINSVRASLEDYMISKITLGTHTGTHIDTPLHATVDTDGLGTLPLEAYAGPARVIDLSHLAAKSLISSQDLKSIWTDSDDIRKIILRTDWFQRCNENRKLDYFTDYPALSIEVANRLVERGVQLIGLESPSVSPDNHMLIHRILMDANMVILESLINVADITSADIEIHAAPLNIPGIDGSPVRAYAVER